MRIDRDGLPCPKDGCSGFLEDCGGDEETHYGERAYGCTDCGWVFSGGDEVGQPPDGMP